MSVLLSVSQAWPMLKHYQPPTNTPRIAKLSMAMRGVVFSSEK